MRTQRPYLKRFAGIIVLVSLVSILLNASSVYLACSLFSSSGCATFKQYPYVPSRKLTDDEIGARVVFEEILRTPPIQSKNPKIAFMFLTPGSLPFEKLWDKFFSVRLYSFLIISLLFNLLLALFMQAYSSSWVGVFKFNGMYYMHSINKISTQLQNFCVSSLQRSPLSPVQISGRSS